MKYRIVEKYEHTLGYICFRPEYKDFIFWNSFCADYAKIKVFKTFIGAEDCIKQDILERTCKIHKYKDK